MKKVVFISGASSGIGRATAILLSKSGYTVYGAARRMDKLDELKAYKIHPLKMDITEEKSIEAAVKSVIDKEGRIDVLINNAGFGIYGTLEDVPMTQARRQFDVNVFGLARLTQEVLPHMRLRNSGIIVNISSVAGKMSIPLGSWYHASKHAVEAISDSLRLEVEPFGIKVIIVEPGIIDTAWWPIAEKNLENVSRKTEYAELVDKGKRYLLNPGPASPPSEIAKTIRKALSAKNPKTRYSAGKKSKLILTGRKRLSDETFDKLIKKNLGL